MVQNLGEQTVMHRLSQLRCSGDAFLCKKGSPEKTIGVSANVAVDVTTHVSLLRSATLFA